MGQVCNAYFVTLMISFRALALILLAKYRANLGGFQLRYGGLRHGCNLLIGRLWEIVVSAASSLGQRFRQSLGEKLVLSVNRQELHV